MKRDLNQASVFASGVYFYRINALSTEGSALFTETKRMILVK